MTKQDAAAATTYIVECFWPDVHAEQVERAGERAKKSAERLSGEGTAVEYTGSILVPEDEIVFYLFEGPSAEAVREVCRRAEITPERVVGSIRATPTPRRLPA